MSIIGIDLGTTTCEIAYLKDGKPCIIEDSYGKKNIPSVVGIINNKATAGNTAQNNINDYSFFASEFKRDIGKKDKFIVLGDEKFTPQELSTILLKELKQIAMDYIGEDITEAVITVPANFNSYQRQLTQQAGILAGLNVERIINEPTAAAMAYGIENIDEEAKILVFDLGGGTFDVTILEMFSGILDVISSRGNNLLGGKDFDTEIENYVLDLINKKYNISLYDDLVNDELINVKKIIKSKVKKAKEELSSIEATNINLNNIAKINNKDISIEIYLTRSEFDKLTKHLVDKTKLTIEEALKAGNLKKEDIDIVLLVGGSTRIVSIKNLVQKMFPNKLKEGINPDEAVALGACVQAGIKNNCFSSDTGLIVTDRCNYNLGTGIVKIIGGKEVSDMFDLLIPVDSSIPCSGKNTYSTSYDDQTSVDIEVYEGYDKFVYNNTKIASFSVDGIPKAPKGVQQVEVEFNYNLNGVLEVNVKIISTGKVQKKIVTNKDIEEVTKNIKKYVENSINEDDWINHPLARVVKRSINLAENKMDSLDEEKRKTLKFLVSKLKQAVLDYDEDLVDMYEEQLTDLLFELRTKG